MESAAFRLKTGTIIHSAKLYRLEISFRSRFSQNHDCMVSNMHAYCALLTLKGCVKINIIKLRYNTDIYVHVCFAS